MTISHPAVPRVAPTFRTIPPRKSSAGREAVDLARFAGLELDDWQADFLDDALSERDDGRWAAFEVGLIVPRQNGKGSILEARELAGLFLFGEELIVHSAHEFKTAADHFRRITGLIDQTPDLAKLCRPHRRSHGDESVELLDGRRLRFMARSRGSGRGFSADLVVMDECYDLSPVAVSAIVPTLSARRNPQIWYTSSAPLPEERSDVLREFCKRGRIGGTSTVYVEYCADWDDDQGDPGTWQKANPAMGATRSLAPGSELTVEKIELERPSLGEEFGRERLGLWREDDLAHQIISKEAWERCRDPKSGPVGEVSFALDVHPERSLSSFAVAADAGNGGTHIEVVERKSGTDWLVAKALDLQEKWGGRLAVRAGSPAASLVDELTAAGVTVVEVSNADHAVACGQLFDAVTEGRIRHLGQPELDSAVAGADRRFTGDAWMWSGRLSLADITPLVAVTLANWLHDQPAAYAPFVA